MVARTRIAVIGTGIAGNVAANRLAREHDVTVYESESYIGGHTHTLDVEYRGKTYAVDTGFIVYNEQTYPKFNALLRDLDVRSQRSTMSFSVHDERTGLEYNGTTINSLFAQRRNLLRPSFHRMIRDILRFNREGPSLLDSDATDITLDEYLRAARYSPEFVERYIVPMGAAIWSAHPELIRQIPAKFFVRFFENHGLLTIDDRPTWRVVAGGSRHYVDKLVAEHRQSIRLDTAVERVRRMPGFVEVKAHGSAPEHFDHVFFACHSDQALRLLADPSKDEREVLGRIEFQTNDVILHTDVSLMPRTRLAWAAWNYHIPAAAQDRVTVTYNMNILQSLSAPVEFCVTLNDSG
ncbi:MAG TPA: FAD-dependent oxidoreductase, partial [Gammaproteobacteria bacterium]|nr:FAD-dependent oxidoreductase [Gammaproteobacteria bacterium]